jgi:hypothetical protein
VKTCPACGSAELGRGRSRTAWQRFLRDRTPFRRFRCRACGAEGWTAGRLPHSQHPEEQVRALAAPEQRPGRPIEPRDVRARWRAVRRTIVTIGIALLLGAIVANRLVSCQGQPSAASSE